MTTYRASKKATWAWQLWHRTYGGLGKSKKRLPNAYVSVAKWNLISTLGWAVSLFRLHWLYWWGAGSPWGDQHPAHTESRAYTDLAGHGQSPKQSWKGMPGVHTHKAQRWKGPPDSLSASAGNPTVAADTEILSSFIIKPAIFLALTNPSGRLLQTLVLLPARSCLLTYTLNAQFISIPSWVNVIHIFNTLSPS